MLSTRLSNTVFGLQTLIECGITVRNNDSKLFFHLASSLSYSLLPSSSQIRNDFDELVAKPLKENNKRRKGTAREKFEV